MRSVFPALMLGMATLITSPEASFAQKPQPQRAAKGGADLSGVWARARVKNYNSTSFGLQVVGEQPVMLPWAQAWFKEVREGRDEPRPDIGLGIFDPVRAPYCLPFGFPRVYDTSYAFEIVQAPTAVHINFEVGSVTRRIYLDGRKHPEGWPPVFMGHSVGRWEGDTLVAETVNLHPLTWLDGLGRPHSDALRIEERIRRSGPNALEINFLVDDPKTYAKPWKGRKDFAIKTGWEMVENTYCE